ncbi:Tripartite tricarboxylate transporter TctB family protein [Halobacillus karajensis]|uniref:tripartite tricarboxylate transporter TctB family protein n=1 Tax=Halobacillus karajensis TaxID=195088 RepID=UPI0008A7A8DB|nr:tripartite tricarboxylate transporter TctB family protein [Halobacillus karajensis]SEI01204.1 Tripartite tricarboxylate transporter TctB family protein [Halobacillus karajensis]
MEDLLTVELSFSEYHLIFPRIVITILLILGAIIVFRYFYKRMKLGSSKKRDFSFFIATYDKTKLFGSAILLFLYPFMMERLGFLISTIGLMFFMTLLFIGKIKKTALFTSLTNALATTFVIWYVFGQLFDITLP